MPRTAAIRGNVHERNRLTGLSKVWKPDARRSPARVRITRLPVQFRETGFFPLFHLPPLLIFVRARRAFRRGRMKEQSKTGGESSYRIVCRWVPLRLHLRRTSTFCTALKADGIRTLCRGGESAVSIALISILFLITREPLDRTIFLPL